MAKYNADRFLVTLGDASTSRVLNLLNIARNNQADPEYDLRPLFTSPVLNRAFILKQGVRPNEIYNFDSRRATVTKVIFPFDTNDLLAGGRSLIFGERGFEETICSIGKYKGESAERDLAALRLVDALPSLDPFLLREHFSNHKVDVAPCYFAISQNDQLKMREFVSGEMERLTVLLGACASKASTQRMVAALLSSDVAQELEPLRTTLSLTAEQFREGVFSWRGFLYYKWCRESWWPQLIEVLRSLKATQPASGGMLAPAEIDAAKNKLIMMVRDDSADISKALAVYDRSYSELVANQAPRAFRDFLLTAPSMFLNVGEKMGAISHIVSFWQYRFPNDRSPRVESDEFMMILEDFRTGFAERLKPPASPLKAPVVIDARRAV
jgi:hypothetical protein